MPSEVARKIEDALNLNEKSPYPLDISKDEPIRVGPLVFRYDPRRTRHRWVVVEDPTDAQLMSRGTDWWPKEWSEWP